MRAGTLAQWKTDVDHATGQRGIDLKPIAEIAGHTSIRTTAMYVGANPKRLARILQLVTL